LKITYFYKNLFCVLQFAGDVPSKRQHSDRDGNVVLFRVSCPIDKSGQVIGKVWIVYFSTRTSKRNKGKKCLKKNPDIDILMPTHSHVAYKPVSYALIGNATGRGHHPQHKGQYRC
jgi:hypothetical protein